MAAAELERARQAVERRGWADAYELFVAADAQTSLEPDDLERLAITAALLAKGEESAEAWARAYNAVIDSDPPRAARCAFWLGLGLMQQGEHARGGGWLGRAGATLAEAGSDCPEAGLMLMVAALQTLDGGDPAGGYELFAQALAIGRRFRDRDLLAMASLGCGQSLISLGRSAEGLPLLDEAMVAITEDEVSPYATGIVYCAVILACYDAFDIRRAHEWTRALDAWSAPQQGLVPFRGQCLVHRSQIKQMHGAWDEALEEATLARERLGDPPGQPAIGLAYYQLGELHRVRGEFDDASTAYRDANASGRSPQPGLALLRLSQGKATAAAAPIRTALEQEREPGRRAPLLSAAAEIALATGDVTGARAAADELASIADDFGAPVLLAMSAAARGAVLIAEGGPADAMTSLREAQRAWLELDVPYEVARTRALIARACALLGDDDTAELERETAGRAFEELHAAPALAELGVGTERLPGGLTAREVEILKLVATGRTNKAIAEELVVSHKTVARHLSNIFTKLDVSSRAEATAYAFKHGLA
ncbi:MAG TPA: response regulator transcription factor [Actinomycetota bacterium]